MSTLTIRQVSDDLKHRLRLRAAANGRSMEAEVRDILMRSLDDARPVDLTWVEALVSLGTELGGVDLDEPIDTLAEAAQFERS